MWEWNTGTDGQYRHGKSDIIAYFTGESCVETPIWSLKCKHFTSNQTDYAVVYMSIEYIFSRLIVKCTYKHTQISA